MPKYNIHKDFAFLRFVPNTKKWMVPAFNALFKWHFKSTKTPSGIELCSHNIKGFDNGEIEILVFKPKNIAANAPCLVYCHGGGFFIEAAAAHKQAMFEYAEKLNCVGWSKIAGQKSILTLSHVKNKRRVACGGASVRNPNQKTSKKI